MSLEKNKLSYEDTKDITGGYDKMDDDTYTDLTERNKKKEYNLPEPKEVNLMMNEKKDRSI